jgi:hypothetical protein
MQDDLTRLIKKPPVENRLDPAKTPLAIRSKIGLERKVAGDVQTEEKTLVSSDGLFTFTVNVLKK